MQYCPAWHTAHAPSVPEYPGTHEHSDAPGSEVVSAGQTAFALPPGHLVPAGHSWHAPVPKDPATHVHPATSACPGSDSVPSAQPFSPNAPPQQYPPAGHTTHAGALSRAPSTRCSESKEPGAQTQSAASSDPRGEVASAGQEILSSGLLSFSRSRFPVCPPPFWPPPFPPFPPSPPFPPCPPPTPEAGQ